MLVGAGALAVVPITVRALDSYVVAPGDTLSKIADEHSVTVDAIARANGLSDINYVLVGQALTIPDSSTVVVTPAATPVAPAAAPARPTVTYMVAAGDTLAAIAESVGSTVADLVALNGLADANLIVVGQVLQVPGKLVAPPPAPAPLPAATIPHTVAEGETLSAIADHYGLVLPAVLAANPLANPNLLSVGQVLQIPVARPVSPAERAEVGATLRKTEQEFGIPGGLLLALAWQESGWQQRVVSVSGAVGVTQVLPETAAWTLEFLVKDAPNWRTSAVDNSRVGGAFFKHLLTLAKGDPAMAIAAYYQGWDSLQAKGVYDETKEYVANVLALWPQFKP